MEWTGLNELREKYLKFFESKDHLRLPSFPLVPQGDKSILLINAGMTPMKKYFTGEETPPRKRVTTCQKCIRTPDIERVGITARHGTYFEMLGNFSFGDYFKKEVIPWAWEFCTQVMEMDPEKIYCSVYLEDDEAYDIWTKDVGVKPDHMVRFGKEDNFWEHGQGPCGPCSELYYDRGEKYGCGSPDCKVGCECDRYVEFWNLVFTQFENDGKNNYTPLAKPNIDTGMGLERLACIAQDVNNIFEVDTVQNIMKHIMEIAGVKYHENEKSDISLRVITDHIRSTTFMIGDGVIPSNVGRGYVLRRLLRRAARHGRLLGIDRPFLAEVCETVIKENENAYPGLREKQDYIIKVISMEENSFYKTIDSGLELLNDMIKKTEGNVLSGADAFKLQDTYGFPIDLTREIAEENGMTVNNEEFEKYLADAKALAKSSRKVAGTEGWKSSDISFKECDATQFTGYCVTEQEGKVLAIAANGEKVDFIGIDTDAVIVLDKSAFYAESGGQVGDTGTLTVNGSVFTVTNTTKTAEGVILHHGTLTEGDAINLGDIVKGEVDKNRREAIMRNHTAAHLLQAALREALGTHVEQAGQLVNDNAVRFDFSHFSALTADEIVKIENRVNEIILSALPVVTEEMSIDDAKKKGAMALFGEKYGDTVRVVSAGDFSTELCGGTHVKNTGNIGLFRIVSESSVAAGVRRIEGVTGLGVLKHLDKQEKLIHDTANALKLANVNDLCSKAAAVAAELKEKEKELADLKAEIAKAKAGELFDSFVEINGVKLITAPLGEADSKELRSMLDSSKDKGDDIIVILAAEQNEKGTCSFGCFCGKSAIAKGAHAGNIVREVAKVAGGAGGGKPDSAMAGGKEIAKIPDALKAAEEIVKTFVK
ncbi:MAG: alanine--tRNA ligase [Ruminococcaceae bacterium]|nr:alanine--tRNA ligase [Oscillospiraceae bacterium]